MSAGRTNAVYAGNNAESAHVVIVNYGYPHFEQLPHPNYGINYINTAGAHSVAQFPDETNNLELDVMKDSFIIPFIATDFNAEPSGGVSYVMEKAYNDEIGYSMSIYLVSGDGTIG